MSTSKPTFMDVSPQLKTLRGPEYFQSLSYVKACLEALDRRSLQAASVRAWERERLPHLKIKAESVPARSTRQEHDCEVISFTFADGSEIGRCKGVRNGVPCAFAFGHANSSLNCKKHIPDLLATASAVDDELDESDSSVPELLPEASPVVAGNDDEAVLLEQVEDEKGGDGAAVGE